MALEYQLPKLFENVSQDTYHKMFTRLQEMRLLHPEYRDDELLMYLLCKDDTLIKLMR